MKKTTKPFPFMQNVKQSISTKMFRMILVFSSVLGLASILFGSYLYFNGIYDQYSVVAYNISQTATAIIQSENHDQYINEVLDVYKAQKDQNKALTKKEAEIVYASVMDERYIQLRELLRNVAKDNGAQTIYIAAYDKELDHLVYIVDTDEIGFPGDTDLVSDEEKSHYADDKSEGIFGLEVPHVFEKDIDDGYVCTSWDVISADERFTVMSMADIDMDRIIDNGLTFLWQFCLILILITLGLDYLISRRIRSTLVNPLIEINMAAWEYISDTGDPETHIKSSHFQQLDIETGDELENLALVMKKMEQDIDSYMNDLTMAATEQERLNAELGIASQIQEGMLPQEHPPFPDRTEFDLAGFMHPAKEVGGDFFTYFLIDEDHLALAIADVSGKGIPGALYMMANMILINNITTMGLMDPGHILEELNNRLMKRNAAEMFITVWLGILEISTGKLTASNGGHEYPYLYRKDQGYELLKDKHGLVLGAMEDIKYTSYTVDLEPGDGIFVYTDGVTEATNIHNELFGDERLFSALNHHPEYRGEQKLEQIKGEIDAFVDTAPQFDDITMLVLHYNGAKKK